MNPTAEAPRLTARRASASEVTPQILTKSSSVIATHGMADQLAQLRRPIAGPHQRLADQDGVVTGVGQAPGVVAVADAGLGDGDHVGRNASRQRAGALVVDLEGAQVALVDPDQAGLRRARARSSSSSSCTSTSAASERSVGQRGEPRQLVVVEGGHDEQHRIGPHQAGIGDVGLVDREVLAQHRQARGLPGRGQVVRDPPKKSASVRTDRQAAPPATYSLATTSGCRLGSRSPLEGERRLISAMQAESPSPAAPRRSPGAAAWPPPVHQLAEGRGRPPRRARGGRPGCPPGRWAWHSQRSGRPFRPAVRSSQAFSCTSRRGRAERWTARGAPRNWMPRSCSARGTGSAMVITCRSSAGRRAGHADRSMASWPCEYPGHSKVKPGAA